MESKDVPPNKWATSLLKELSLITVTELSILPA